MPLTFANSILSDIKRSSFCRSVKKERGGRQATEKEILTVFN